MTGLDKFSRKQWKLDIGHNYNNTNITISPGVLVLFLVYVLDITGKAFKFSERRVGSFSNFSDWIDLKESDMVKIFQGEDLVDWSHIMDGDKQADLCIRYNLYTVKFVSLSKEIGNLLSTKFLFLLIYSQTQISI